MVIPESLRADVAAFIENHAGLNEEDDYPHVAAIVRHLGHTPDLDWCMDDRWAWEEKTGMDGLTIARAELIEADYPENIRANLRDYLLFDYMPGCKCEACKSFRERRARETP